MMERWAATLSRHESPPSPLASRWGAGLRLYARLLRATVAAQRQYAVDFALGLGVTVLLTASEAVSIVVILWRFHAIGGWGPADIAVLYGVATAAYALHRLCAGDLHSLSEYVRSGEFDALLLRPCSPLFALLARSGRVNQLAGLIVPVAAMVAGGAHLAGAGGLRLWGVAALVGVLLCAVAMQFAVGIATNAAAFWIVRADELTVLTVNAPNTAAAYPLGVYPGWLRGYLTGIVPVGLVCYFPVRRLLGLGGGWGALAGAPAAAAVALSLALWIWWRGQNRYSSTGT